jgi:hypothetical protein
LAQAAASNSLSIGFLTILQEGSAHSGGYLVTNSWGRPVEFRMSSAVQPTRIQQILYGRSLQPFVCADLIGRTLIEKTSIAVQLLVTNDALVLDVRHRVSTPLVWLSPPKDETFPAEVVLRRSEDDKPMLVCHPRFPEDAAVIRSLLEKIDPGFDLAEPFSRIREAMSEARRMNVTRAA